MPILKNGKRITDKYQAICDECGARSMKTNEAACPYEDGTFACVLVEHGAVAVYCAECAKPRLEKKMMDRLPPGLKELMRGGQMVSLGGLAAPQNPGDTENPNQKLIDDVMAEED